uniref:Uncharacterized protein n=1 Tax=Rhizophora mucronata TaxID=61149 RepID=A0A2P2M4R1_RHIMU
MILPYMKFVLLKNMSYYKKQCDEREREDQMVQKEGRLCNHLKQRNNTSFLCLHECMLLCMCSDVQGQKPGLAGGAEGDERRRYIVKLNEKAKGKKERLIKHTHNITFQIQKKSCFNLSKILKLTIPIT